MEFETWFIASADAKPLAERFDLARITLTENPERARQGKGSVQKMLGRTYKERVDQPRLTAVFDLHLCRSRSPSFDKLCRELERRKTP